MIRVSALSYKRMVSLVGTRAFASFISIITRANVLLPSAHHTMHDQKHRRFRTWAASRTCSPPKRCGSGPAGQGIPARRTAAATRRAEGGTETVLPGPLRLTVLCVYRARCGHAAACAAAARGMQARPAAPAAAGRHRRRAGPGRAPGPTESRLAARRLPPASCSVGCGRRAPCAMSACPGASRRLGIGILGHVWRCAIV